MPQMIIANRLTDGVVVFLDPRENWDPSIGAGAVIEGDTEAERLVAVAERHVAECRVIDPTLIEVEIANGQPRPTAMREAIRAFGPTVRTDLTEV